MLEYDPHDYDLIQAREDNLVLINKRLLQLQDIQNELKPICPTHPLISIDVYDKILKKEGTKEEIITELEL